MSLYASKKIAGWLRHERERVSEKEGGSLPAESLVKVSYAISGRVGLEGRGDSIRCLHPERTSREQLETVDSWENHSKGYASVEERKKMNEKETLAIRSQPTNVRKTRLSTTYPCVWGCLVEHGLRPPEGRTGTFFNDSSFFGDSEEVIVNCRVVGVSTGDGKCWRR